MPRRFADLKHNVFARHSNPWSAWTRWLSAPLVLVPLWTRRWSHAAIVGAWMAANPVIFPKPADEHAWSTRVVLGEELWITERPRDTAMAVDAAATLAGITALIAARQRRAVPAAGATAVMMALLLVYWRLMADYYNRHRTPTPAERRIRVGFRSSHPPWTIGRGPARARLIATQVLGFAFVLPPPAASSPSPR